MNLDEQKYLEAPAKVLKLSEAARIGARKHPQLIDITAWHADGCTCFYGAAAVGRGWDLSCGRLHNFITDDELEYSSDAYAVHYGKNLHKEIKDGLLTREQVADRMEAIGF